MLGQPAAGGVEQRARDLGVVLELEEAEHAGIANPAHPVLGVVGLVDLRADAPDDALAAARDELLRLGVLEVRVQLAAVEELALEADRGDPLLGGSMQAERELDELPAIPP